MKLNITKSGGVRKLYYCVELDEAFISSTAAAEATNTDASSIIKASKGIRHSAGKHPETGEKLHWKIIEYKGRKE